MALSDIIQGDLRPILQAWVTAVRHTSADEEALAREAAEREQVLAGVAAYLQGEPGPLEEAAASHGAAARARGHSLCSVIDDYGRLLEVVANGTVPTPVVHEVQGLAQAVFAGLRAAAAAHTAEQTQAQAERTRQQFSFIAHDLRTPLQAIKIAAGLLGRDLDPTRRRSTIDLLQRSVGEMDALLERSLLEARLRGDVAVRPERLDLRAVVQEQVQLVAPQAERAGVEVRVRCEREACPVEADRTLVRAAVQNLLTNAIKFTPRGHSVEVRLSAVGDACRVEVEDACGGLGVDDLSALFDPGARGDPGKPGHGLGLPIVAQAIDAQGGEVEVRDRPGEGCVFSFQLPVQVAPARAASARRWRGGVSRGQEAPRES